MIKNLRVLPLFILAATILFGVKLGNIWLGVEYMFAGSTVRAETATGSGVSEEEEHGPSSAAAEAEAEPEDDFADQPEIMSKGELELLQDLSARRSQLDARERGLQMRERVIEVTESRVDTKLADIKEIEANIQVLLNQYDSQQEARLMSLVKVYETMKPKDAARIFSSLGLDILIPVAERMKEAKIAPILSKMDDAAAKALTVELATKRDVAAVVE